MRYDETALVEKNVRIECEREDIDAAGTQRTPAVKSSRRPQRGAGALVTLFKSRE